MRIVVLVKQLPDPVTRPTVNEGRLERQGVSWVADEASEAALAAAVELKREGSAEEVVVVGHGPERIEETMRRALARGADRAVRIDSPRDDLDAVVLGRDLAGAVQSLEPTLVLAGAQSSWLGRAAVPGVVAAQLGWPHVWLATALGVEDDREHAEVVRELEGGRSERCRVRLPAVVSVQVGSWSLGMASVRDLLAARRREIETSRVDAAEGAGEAARARLEAWLEPEDHASKVEMLSGEPEEMARELVSRLEREDVL